MNENFLSQINPNLLVYIGIIGFGIGIISIVILIYRRIRKLLSLLTSREYSSPGLVASLRNLLLIMLWSFVFGMLLFIGFFLRSYHVYTLEKPVAKIKISPTLQPQTMKINLIQLNNENLPKVFLIKGDQWLLEGDILKWDNWLNFLGLQTRYRFTRIRGRYLSTEDEMQKEKTVYSLVEDENNPFWNYLYHYGQKLPLVSTVYGNAVFQYGDKKREFLVFVTLSGFIVREGTT